MICCLVISVLACLPWRQIRDAAVDKGMPWPAHVPEGIAFFAEIVKRVAVLILLVVCYMFIINSSYNPFIYFRF